MYENFSEENPALPKFIFKPQKMPLPETEPEKKEEKKYSLSTLVFVVIMVFGLTFISLYIYSAGEIKNQTTAYTTNLTEWQNANTELENQKNNYKVTGALFFNYLKLAHELKDANSVDFYLQAQQDFMAKYYEMLYYYSDADLNKKLAELNTCLIQLRKVQEEAGDINAKQAECATLDSEATEQLYQLLKEDYADVFGDGLIE